MWLPSFSDVDCRAASRVGVEVICLQRGRGNVTTIVSEGHDGRLLACASGSQEQAGAARYFSPQSPAIRMVKVPGLEVVGLNMRVLPRSRKRRLPACEGNGMALLGCLGDGGRCCTKP